MSLTTGCSFINSFLLPVLRGFGQILFQPSARTGAVLLLLILSQSPQALAMCLAGLLGATLCAFVLEREGNAYAEGAGGFNGALLGLALSVIFEFGPVLLAVCFTGGLLTGLFRVALLRLSPLPPFTAPFIVVTWLADYLCRHVLALDVLFPSATTGPPIQTLATSASQVIFVSQPWIGTLVVIAVMLHSRLAAAWIAAASIVAWLTTLGFGLPPGLAADGLLGYNALILAAALHGGNTPILMALCGAVASVWLSFLFFQMQVTPLSAPFVLTAWLIIGVRDRPPTDPGPSVGREQRG
jgi:urea transporter